MGLRKQKGNMFEFVTHTWNAIKGKCSHGCSYCYMIPFWRSDVYLDEKELKTNLGEGNFIFIGSGTDMFAEDVPKDWIFKVLEHCNKYPKNKYLFQSKNPKRFHEFSGVFPEETILGTTIETNKQDLLDKISKAPDVYNREYWIGNLPLFKTMITIEPIIDFDVVILRNWLKQLKPNFVNIGADSKGHKLPEPSPEKIKELIKELEKFTKVNIKINLKRLIS